MGIGVDGLLRRARVLAEHDSLGLADVLVAAYRDMMTATAQHVLETSQMSCSAAATTIACGAHRGDFNDPFHSGLYHSALIRGRLNLRAPAMQLHNSDDMYTCNPTALTSAVTGSTSNKVHLHNAEPTQLWSDDAAAAEALSRHGCGIREPIPRLVSDDPVLQSGCIQQGSFTAARVDAPDPPQ